jgi:hypothetical protein
MMGECNVSVPIAVASLRHEDTNRLEISKRPSCMCELKARHHQSSAFDHLRRNVSKECLANSFLTVGAGYTIPPISIEKVDLGRDTCKVLVYIWSQKNAGE